MPENKGYSLLCKDLYEIWTEATQYEFDDFKNRKYATPKVELHKKLTEIINKNRAGEYDQ